MLETSARLLRLLSILQSRRDWTGTELASRLEVTTRTVRNDVERLRRLGYPVVATPGVGGGYRLGLARALPPGRYRVPIRTLNVPSLEVGIAGRKYPVKLVFPKAPRKHGLFWASVFGELPPD